MNPLLKLLILIPTIFCRSAFGATLEVQPNVVTIVYGKVVAGDVLSLGTIDANCLRVARFTLPVAPFDPVTFRVEATLPVPPASLTFHITGRQLQGGTYSQSLNLYDWTKSVFEPTTNVTTILSKDDQDMSCPNVGDVTRYYRERDNRVWALVRVRPIGFTPIVNWQIDYDRAWFAAESGP